MPKLTRILAAIVDTSKMTLYKEDGEKIIINQGDARLRRIVEIAGPMIEQYGYADVDLSEAAEDTTYVDFEANTNGIVKFFRVAKEKLKQLLALGVVEEAPVETVEPTTIGVLPGSDDQEETFDPVKPAEPAPKTHTMAAVDEIIAHAVPVSSKDFTEEGIVKQRPIHVNGRTENSHPSETAEDTIIAVVNDKVIPNMELIKSQIGRAAKLGSTIGVERFLQRLSTVIEQRSHSVEDLLKFLERGDLPIADDGSILIYKVLNKRDEKTYVDCHSGRVEQFVGAYVCMDKSLVDHNRNNECSNGLHVARRGYVSNFYGSICVLAKLAPEDVITVPKYDANKLRACGYHILFELTGEQFSLLKRNRPLTDNPAGKELLAKAMRGDHIHITHEVRITGQMGSDVITKELYKPIQPELAPVPDAPREEEALLDDQTAKDTPVMPGNVVKTIEQSVSRREQAIALYNAWANAEGLEPKAEALNNLTAFKRAAKVSWDRLGIPDPTKSVSKYSAKKESGKAILKQKAETKSMQAMKPLPQKVIPTEGSPRERITKLITIGIDKQIATHILSIKKAAKKSWETLGVKQKDVDKILKLTDGA